MKNLIKLLLLIPLSLAVISCTDLDEEIRGDFTKDFVHIQGVTAFDNLAVDQLRLREVLGDKNFNDFYMGDDGEYTMYVDAVEERFAVSSTSEKRYWKSTCAKAFRFIKNGCVNDYTYDW